ncbi:MAG: SpoIIE family protein phosphatase, partial [Ignavibacteria bacterium]|nr:SpoIIE family protein phosphatase [Ignavibacteria bacterium]
TEKRVMQLCRAGHTSTLLFGVDGCERIKSAGIGLGLDKGEVFDSSLEEVAREISKGMLLAIYSDGISEAMNVRQEEFGEERIVGVLQKNIADSVVSIQSKILDEVNIFCGGAEQHDDITLLLVKFL